MTPNLPSQVNAVSFKVHYQGHHVSIQVGKGGVRIQAHDCDTPHPLRVNMCGSTAVLLPGTTRHFPGSPSKEGNFSKP